MKIDERIVYFMNYIVFDLEWNQCPDGKWAEDERLPFEIIEIGAVKLNSERVITDSFHELIRPTVYKWIHSRTREVVHLDYQDLLDGEYFPKVVQRFLEWCGEDYIFCSWGTQDLLEMQKNLSYFDLLHLVKGPIHYYDIQKLFSLRLENGKKRRSLEMAIELLRISKDLSFHRALTDAYYTAVVFQKIYEDSLAPFTSIDLYQNPKKRREEQYISYPTYDKYVSKEFDSKEKAMKDRIATSTKCPACHGTARRKVRWFSVNAKQYYSISICPEHGMVKGKIRMRKSDNDKFYVVKTLKLIGEEEKESILEKKEALRIKRYNKKHQIYDE